MNRFFSRALAIILGALLLNFSAYSQAWQWATAPTVSSTSGWGSKGVATAVTPNGETLTSYSFSATITLGSNSYPATHTSDCALVRYNNTGQIIDIPLVGGLWVQNIAVDAAGNWYAAGRQAGAFNLGATNIPLQNSGGDVFLMKWNAAGIMQWYQRGQSTSGYLGNDTHITVDGTGNVTIAGRFAGDLTFGNQTVTAVPVVNSSFMAQFDATGSFRWLQSSTNQNASVEITDLAAAPNGTLYATGFCQGNSFDWGSSQVTCDATRSSFWLQLDAGGRVQAQEVFGDQNVFRNQIETDANGGVYVMTYSYQPSIRWGNAVLPLPNGLGDAAYVLKVGPQKNLLWVQTIGTSLSGTPNDVVGPTQMCVQNVGGGARIYVGGNYRGQSAVGLLCDGIHLNSPALNGSDGFLATLDGTTGSAYWLRASLSSNSNDDLPALGVNAAGQLSIAGLMAGGRAAFGSIQVTSSHTIQAVSAKMLQQYNVLEGQAFIDTNNNLTRDSAEFGRRNVVVEALPGPIYYTTNEAGNYNAIAQLGNYSLQIPTPPPYHNVVATGSTAAAFSSYGNISGGHDFALQPIPGQQDLQVFCTVYPCARPGAEIAYRLTAYNVGTVTIPQATIDFTFDPLLTYLRSNYAPAGQSATSLTWHSYNLRPGASVDFDVAFRLDTSAVMGYSLTATATLEPRTGDLVPADNVETTTVPVTASFDPNDIQVNFPTLTLPQVQQAQQPLDYTVRFQNTGNDTAFSVVVIDTLPANLLNLGSIQVLSVSHTCIWRLAPGGVLVVEFPDINLPSRTQDILASMGYMRFRVLPRVTLGVGTTIINHARIDFDYNPPVMTNAARTMIVNPAGLREGDTANTLNVWPNPTSGILNVEMDGPDTQAVQYQLLDAVGRVVFDVPGTARQKFSTRGLAAGLYLLRATAAGQTISRRLAVR